MSAEPGWRFGEDDEFSEGDARPRPGGSTAEGFDAQWRPDRPRCGGPVEVQPVGGRDYSGRTL